MSQAQGLVLAAHGSRRAESNQEVEQFAQTLAEQLTGISQVVPAFLELATPSITEAIATLSRAGCQKITVIPYFLAAGRHVIADVPQIIAQSQALYPEVEIVVTPHLGASAGLQATVIDLYMDQQA